MNKENKTTIPPGFWEVRRDGVTLSWGPPESFPDAKARKRFRLDGHKIYVDGKLYKEAKDE